MSHAPLILTALLVSGFVEVKTGCQQVWSIAKMGQRWRHDDRVTRILRPEVRDEKSLSAKRWGSACCGVWLCRGERPVRFHGGPLSDLLLRRTGGRVDQPVEPQGPDHHPTVQSGHCGCRQYHRSL